MALTLMLHHPGSFAQAGSSPPMLFHDSKIATASGSVTRLVEPMLPEAVIGLADQEQYLLWVDVSEGKLNVLERDGKGGLELR